jgi:hypothetical protein
LLEPQRTNLALSSEQFNNSTYWVASNSVVAANSAVSPDGNQNADLWYPSTSGDVSSRRLLQSTTVSSVGINVTASVFVKRNNKRWLYFAGPSATSVNHNCWFDLQNGVVGTKGSLVVSATINDFGNGWYRCSVTSLSTSTTQYVFLSATDADADGTVTASGTNGLYLYGAQIEEGAYATSYIPTLAASVTRVADAASKTGISSLIGQTEGVLFFDFIFKTPEVATNGQIGISNPTSPRDRVLVWNEFTLNTLAANLQVNGANIFNTSLGTFVDGQRYKIAIAYKSGSNAAYVNGTQIFTNTNTFTFASTMSDFILGAYETAMIARHQLLNQALLFKTRLTNAQLAELTTL